MVVKFGLFSRRGGQLRGRLCRLEQSVRSAETQRRVTKEQLLPEVY